MMGPELNREQLAIWDGALAVADSLKRSDVAISRNAGDFSKVDGVDTVSTEVAHYENDGTKTIYTIAVSVSRRTDSQDSYWDEQAARPENAVIIGGHHYRIGSYNGEVSAFKGYGGRKFLISFLADGVVRAVDDLWYQGQIPPAHRDRFPDNAVFVRPELGEELYGD